MPWNIMNDEYVYSFLVGECNPDISVLPANGEEQEKQIVEV